MNFINISKIILNQSQFFQLIGNKIIQFKNFKFKYSSLTYSTLFFSEKSNFLIEFCKLKSIILNKNSLILRNIHNSSLNIKNFTIEEINSDTSFFYFFRNYKISIENSKIINNNANLSNFIVLNVLSFNFIGNNLINNQIEDIFFVFKFCSKILFSKINCVKSNENLINRYTNYRGIFLSVFEIDILEILEIKIKNSTFSQNLFLFENKINKANTLIKIFEALFLGINSNNSKLSQRYGFISFFNLINVKIMKTSFNDNKNYKYGCLLRVFSLQCKITVLSSNFTNNICNDISMITFTISKLANYSNCIFIKNRAEKKKIPTANNLLYHESAFIYMSYFTVIDNEIEGFCIGIRQTIIKQYQKIWTNFIFKDFQIVNNKVNSLTFFLFAFVSISNITIKNVNSLNNFFSGGFFQKSCTDFCTILKQDIFLIFEEVILVKDKCISRSFGVIEKFFCNVKIIFKNVKMIYLSFFLEKILSDGFSFININKKFKKNERISLEVVNLHISKNFISNYQFNIFGFANLYFDNCLFLENENKFGGQFKIINPNLNLLNSVFLKIKSNSTSILIGINFQSFICKNITINNVNSANSIMKISNFERTFMINSNFKENLFRKNGDIINSLNGSLKLMNSSIEKIFFGNVLNIENSILVINKVLLTEFTKNGIILKKCKSTFENLTIHKINLKDLYPNFLIEMIKNSKLLSKYLIFENIQCLMCKFYVNFNNSLVELKKLKFNKVISLKNYELFYFKMSFTKFYLTDSFFEDFSNSGFFINNNVEFYFIKGSVKNFEKNYYFTLNSFIQTFNAFKVKILIQFVDFSNIFCIKNGALINSKSMKSFSEIKLIEIKAINCKSKLFGGIIYISESIIFMMNCFIKNNQAKRGGVIYYECKSLKEICNLTLIGNKFQENSAILNGGVIVWKIKEPNLFKNYFINNTATYGSNFFSFAIKFVLKVLNINNIKIFDSQNSGFFFTNYSNSLLPIQNVMKFHLAGSYNQKIKENLQSAYIMLNSMKKNYNLNSSENLLKFKLQMNLSKNNNFNGTKEEIYGNLAQYQNLINFEFNFNKIYLIGTPSTALFLNFSSKLIIYNKNYLISKKPNELIKDGKYNFIIPVVINSCKLGEIYLFESNICEKCSYGLFNIKLYQTKCQDCLKNVECKGGFEIIVNKGYWRSSIFSINIYKCAEMLENCLGFILFLNLYSFFFLKK